jgi:hypothetical protein
MEIASMYLNVLCFVNVYIRLLSKAGGYKLEQGIIEQHRSWLIVVLEIEIHYWSTRKKKETKNGKGVNCKKLIVFEGV